MGRKITPLQALKMYGCFRLGARIYNLKEQGMKIITKIIPVISAGETKHVAQYSLKK